MPSGCCIHPRIDPAMPADIAEALLLAITGAAVSEEDLRNAAVDIYVIICLPESIS